MSDLSDGAAAAQHRVPTPLYPVVGVGASAGGLPALIRLLESLPSSTGMAFVVVLHLSPKHQSKAAEILQKATGMRAMQVTGTVKIEPDHVYVIAPKLDLTMVDGELQVANTKRVPGRPAVIDIFFRTLAEAHKERAIAIVLSGTGSDGAVGIADVKDKGGVVLAQSLEDCEFDQMPRNAIATGRVDIVLTASRMGPWLIDTARNMQRIEMPPPESALPESTGVDASDRAEAALREVMAMLHRHTGHDFKHYKRATVLRRIERRLQVSGQPNLPAYQSYLVHNPGEIDLLLSDMLIGVTNFFRDRSAFEALERTVVPALFSEAQHEEQLRVWVPGCSTGEEVYSLAMLLMQEAETASPSRSFQIFATDIDSRALLRARASRYPDSIVTDVPPQLLRRFTTKENGDLRIVEPVRDTVLFAQHNLLRDPPFSRLDMISCRNLMMYLDRGVQRDILQLFHYALRPGGYLFLGSSETVDPGGTLFQPVDASNRIYRANPSVRALRVLPRFPLGGSDLKQPFVPAAGDRRLPELHTGELHQRALLKHSPASLLVDANGKILNSHNAERYLRFEPHQPSHQLLSAAVLPELSAGLRALMFQMGQEAKHMLAVIGQLQRDGQQVTVSASVAPVQYPSWGGLMLILFSEVTDRAETDPTAAGSQDPMVDQLEAELWQKNLQVQESIGQYETAAQELKATNEELQAINEELRSATEELEASKEELQSTNEELTTVNHELKMKIDETSEINDDLQNLITSTDIATVFVDRGMRIKRFTAAAARIFNIIAGDVGRSLLDITHRLQYDGLAADVAASFGLLRTVENEIATTDGRWLLARVLPYRTLDDRIDGAVLTFVDITSRRHAERNVHLAEERMQLIAENMPDFAILTMNEEGIVTSWNVGAEKMLGYTAREIIGQPGAVIFTDEDREHGVAQSELEGARKNGRALDERWHRRKDGSTIYLSGITAHMPMGLGFAKIARDMTAKREEETTRAQALSTAVQDVAVATAANQAKDEFLAIMSHELKHPLNLIQLNTQLLLALPEAKANAAVGRIGRTIQQSIRGQTRIIDDLLDISRTQAGKLVLNVKHMTLNDALRPCLDWAEKAAADKNITLAVKLTEEALPVEIDPIRFEQIVLNLLSNAVKFTPTGGQVTVTLARQHNEALLQVSDSGRGIDSKFLPQVFELFKQAEPYENRSEGGLGIGLALVKDLVSLHGGEVRAESAGAGKGATFSVTVPLRVSSEFAGLDLLDEGEGLTGLRVLYVDDTRDTLEIFGTLLEMEGAIVRTAQGGHAALKLVDEEIPDLVLSDIGMPGMDGYQLITALRQIPGMKDVPAVALTGYGRPQDAEKAMSSGFSSHMSKPIELVTLRALLKKLNVKPR